MAIYRPIKKWLLPLVFALIGLAISLSFFPSKQDAIYKEWTRSLNTLNDQVYEVETSFIVDNTIYSESKGHWNEPLTYYQVTTPFNDGTSFQFDVFFTPEKFYIQSGDEWSYGDMPHRILNEFIPLDDPFNWIENILQDADTITKQATNSTITYKALFEDFSDIEFRGIRLQKQEKTYLIMTINNNGAIGITFDVKPVRPDDIGLFTSYPKSFTYKITLVGNSEEQKIILPNEALNANPIE
ncbi:hypothetical protein [Bacillus sp. Marseille-P3661]|uniref:hypothetical protein n=1 Tax=Bacillus sp. Marseille-P3661 TaxID=1936234 RepID=UPI000C81F7E0|nr:hypothetical protein [Bacillus sp. Marseille-P3661]